MSYLAISEAEKNLTKLIDDITDCHEPAIISDGKRTAVIISIEDWEGMKESLFVASNKELSNSIIMGLNTPFDQCIKEKDLPDEFAWLRDRNKNV